MQPPQLTLIYNCAGLLVFMAMLILIGENYNLNRIKKRTVGDGQHGTARFASKREINKTYITVPYRPALWRKGQNLPTAEGLIVGTKKGLRLSALVDTGDVHALMIGASGIGKTAFFLYPNIEYACACGMSFISTDTKGDIFRNTAPVAQNCYGYDISVIDLRNPTRSNEYNMLSLVNKYMDLYKKNKELRYRGKAEKFAKIVAKTIVNAGNDQNYFGQNSYFYESAEGLITSAILLISEYCSPSQRHIISVFKIIQDLFEPSNIKGKNRFQLMLELLPPDHKARWFAGAALNTGDQAMASVLSTALSCLTAFLDSELEQILCFDTSIDMDSFCKHKSAVYLVLPEEDTTKHFLVSLMFQQFYRELLTIADEQGGQLQKRVMFFADEIGTLPKIESLDMMFSASRSRKISIVAIIQSLAQFEKTYGKEGAEIIADNCQLAIFGSFAPNSKTAEVLSHNLGSQTVLSGSVSHGHGQPGEQLQMIERSLLSADELKGLRKGSFIITKTGEHPMHTTLPIFYKWGLEYTEKYYLPERATRRVSYATREELENSISCARRPE